MPSTKGSLNCKVMKDMYSPFFNLVYLSLFAESDTRNSRSPVPRKKTISLSLFDLHESALAEDLLFSLLEHPSLGILDQASHLRPSASRPSKKV